MSVCTHYLSRKLLLLHPFVLVFVSRVKSSRGSLCKGIEMALEVSAPPLVPGDEFMRPHSPEDLGHDLPSIPLHSHSFHFHKHQ